jgi:hypothetical protein
MTRMIRDQIAWMFGPTGSVLMAVVGFGTGIVFLTESDTLSVVPNWVGVVTNWMGGALMAAIAMNHRRHGRR